VTLIYTTAHTANRIFFLILQNGFKDRQSVVIKLKPVAAKIYLPTLLSDGLYKWALYAALP
jgi:hypothetical protein